MHANSILVARARRAVAAAYFTAVVVALLIPGQRADAGSHYTGDGGVSPFYTWSNPLDRPRGTLLRHESLGAAQQLQNAKVSERILYVSTDGVGGVRKIAVSGTVYIPNGKPPTGGWPTIAWAHGTVGVADPCAPSWRGWLSRDRAYLNAWLNRGYAVVASDYQGLGTPGMHPYMQWRPEAYSVLDAVRAASAGFPLARRVVIVGQSQGSEAALAAAYEAPMYAPEVGVRAVVATGLVVTLAKPVPHAPKVMVPPYADSGSVDAAYSMLYLLGIDQVLKPTLNVDDDVLPAGKPLLHTAVTACLTQLFKEAAAENLDDSKVFTPARERLRAFEDAQVAFPAARLRVPIFTGTGLADAEAGTAPQYNFIAALCTAGTPVVWRYYPGLTHNGTVNASLADSIPFVKRIMGGINVTSNCAALKPPGPLQAAIAGVPYND